VINQGMMFASSVYISPFSGALTHATGCQGFVTEPALLNRQVKPHVKPAFVSTLHSLKEEAHDTALFIYLF
jgi:hypothetical protein